MFKSQDHYGSNSLVRNCTVLVTSSPTNLKKQEVGGFLLPFLWRLARILLECKSASKGQSEPAPSSAVHHERWMISGQETVFCSVLVLKLTMVVSSVAY